MPKRENLKTLKPGNSNENPKGFWWVITGVTTLVVVAVLASFWGKVQESAENSLYEERSERNIQNYEKIQEEYESAMRADTYGGKTPEETIELLISALEKDDIELASKYFALNTDLDSPDYLTQNLPLKELERIKNSLGLDYLKNLLNKKEIDHDGPLYEGDYGFIIKEDGELVSEINMELNPFTKVWKIESL